jgi:catechol 2,3-dioxygenase
MTVHELGHIVLYVKNAERSRRFYRDVLGWKEIPSPPGFPGALFSSGRTHHELLLLEVGEGASPPPRGRRTGLYHFGLKVGTTDDELWRMLDVLRKNNVTVVGATDHGVTHSLYIADPDGNEIELYIDVQPERWRDDPSAILAPPRPLRMPARDLPASPSSMSGRAVDPD